MEQPHACQANHITRSKEEPSTAATRGLKQAPSQSNSKAHLVQL